MDQNQVDLPPIGTSLPAVGKSVSVATLPPVGTSVSAPTPTALGRLEALGKGLVDTGKSFVKSTVETGNPLAGGLKMGWEQGKQMATNGKPLLTNIAEGIGIPVTNLKEDYEKGAIGAGIVDLGQTTLSVAGLKGMLRPGVAASAAEVAAETPKVAPKVEPASNAASISAEVASKEPIVAPTAEIPPVGAKIPAEPAVTSAPWSSSQGPIPRVPESQLEQMAKARGEEVPAAKPVPPSQEVTDALLKKFPEENQPILKQILDENRGFANVREVVPDERSRLLARELQVDSTKSMPKGYALNDIEARALANAAKSAMDRTDALAKKVAAGEGTPSDLLLLQKARLEATALLQSTRVSAAVTARTLRTYQDLAEAYQRADNGLLQAAMKRPELREMENFAEEWNKLPDDNARIKFIHDHTKSSLLDEAISIFYTNILGGPPTHVRNVVGTMSNMAFRNAARPVAGAIDAARAALTGTERTIYPGAEFAEGVKAAPEGIIKGAQDFGTTLKQGYAPREGPTSFDVPRKELPGGGLNPLNWPGRALEAEDMLMRGMHSVPELAARARAAAEMEATKQGLVGPARDAFVTQRTAELRATPTDAIKSASNLETAQALFREKGGPLAEWFAKLKDRGLAGKMSTFVVPFVRIAANITRQGIEATPLAPLTKQFREAIGMTGSTPTEIGQNILKQARDTAGGGARLQSEALGRMATGTLATGLLYKYALEGRISGAGPSDPRERAQLMESGWRPYSIHIGNKWYPYEVAAQTISIPLKVVATAAEQYRATGQPPNIGHLVASTGNIIQDQSFLSGVSDISDAMSDPDRYGPSVAARFAQGLVPGSGMLRAVTRAIDPTVRQPHGPVEGMEAIIPGLSERVTPRLTRFGEPVQNLGNAFMRATNPLEPSPESTDPVVQALAARGITNIGLPPKTLSASTHPPGPAIQLSTEEQQRIGRATKEAIASVVLSPGFSQLDDDAAKALIERMVQATRSRLLQRIRLEHR